MFTIISQRGRLHNLAVLSFLFSNSLLASFSASNASGLSSGSTITYGNYLVTPDEFNNGNSGTTKTINLANGSAQKVTMTGNCTFTLSNPQTGGSYVLKLVQDGTGNRTATWPAAVLWSNGVAPTLSTVRVNEAGAGAISVNFTGDELTSATDTFLAQEPFVLVVTTRGAGTLEVYKDTTMLATGACTTSPTNMKIGTDYGSNTFFYGYMSECLIYVTELNTSSRTAVTNHLMQKYGIT